MSVRKLLRGNWLNEIFRRSWSFVEKFTVKFAVLIRCSDDSQKNRCGIPSVVFLNLELRLLRALCVYLMP